MAALSTQGHGVDYKGGVGRADKVNYFDDPIALAASDHQPRIATVARRERRLGKSHDVLGFVGSDAMLSRVFEVPVVPPELHLENIPVILRRVNELQGRFKLGNEDRYMPEALWFDVELDTLCVRPLSGRRWPATMESPRTRMCEECLESLL
jgi:hypothetical protein